MPKSKLKTWPSFESLDEAVKFFDTHDIGEYWEQMPEAHFDVKLRKRKLLVPIDDEVVSKVAEIAKSKRVSSERLINSWLRERIRKAS